MSGLWSIFGGSSAAQKRKDSPKNAILELRSQADMLAKREKHLQSQIDDQDAIARKNVSTNKTVAMNALRRKKLHEKSLEQTMNQIISIEQQVNAIESANINSQTLQAMDKAGKALKDIHADVTPEKVDKIMADVQEQTQLSDEIVEAVSSSIAQTADEGELEDELKALQEEEVENQLLTSGNVPVSAERLPSVPSSAIQAPAGKAKAAEEDEEAMLQKLRAEMAM